jgi:hypothetical protein
MALIVEDGTGLADAESFASVADATAYHAARGNAAWAALASDELREQLLRRATDYMEAFYRTQWAGCRVKSTQALSWPRYDVPLPDVLSLGNERQVLASDIVPKPVKNACAELALRAITADLAPDIGRQKSSVSVGPIDVTYSESSAPFTRFRAVDNMVAVFFGDAGGMNLKVVRA